MNSVKLRVAKLGGSLLAHANLRDAVTQWCESNPCEQLLIVVGGGLWADGVREAFDRFQLDEATCHWLCIDLLSQTASLAATILDLPLLRDVADAEAHSFDLNRAIFDCNRMLRDLQDEQRSNLPESWSVSSDSIAAHLAERLQANELVLWKSATPPEGSLETWSQTGYVDSHFPIAAKRLRVRAVNLADCSTWNAN